jgi:tripartite-type tricarboxylate transporter receptor subunit TctC
LLGVEPNHPKLASIPHFNTTERALYDLLGMVGQAFYLPPGTQKNVVSILRKSFAAMMADPAFKANIEKRRNEYSPVSVEQIKQKIKNASDSATPKVLKALRNVYQKKKS